VITLHGAIRVTPSPGVEVALFRFRDQALSPVALFESHDSEGSTFLRRALPGGSNPAVLNIDGSLARLKPPFQDTLFIYGIHNQYDLEDGDLLYLRLRPRGEGEEALYYFRVHREGVQIRPDATTLLPLSVDFAGEQPEFEAADVSFALAAAFRWNLDPARDPGWGLRLAAGVEPTLFAGAFRESRVQADGAVRSESDLFAGAGLTAAGFLNAGAGLTVMGPDRTPFLFGGLHLGGLLAFLERVGENPARRWDRYFQQELEATSGEGG